jgi:hypothetical protein
VFFAPLFQLLFMRYHVTSDLRLDCWRTLIARNRRDSQLYAIDPRDVRRH